MLHVDGRWVPWARKLTITATCDHFLGGEGSICRVRTQKIGSGHDMAARDNGGLSDPYVVFTIDGQKPKKTKVGRGRGRPTVGRLRRVWKGGGGGGGEASALATLLRGRVCALNRVERDPVCSPLGRGVRRMRGGRARQTAKATVNPVWNDDLELIVTHASAVDVRVLDRDRIGHDDMCGQVQVDDGSGCRGRGQMALSHAR